MQTAETSRRSFPYGKDFMLEALPNVKPEIYGVFELSDDGTILYSRQKSTDSGKYSFEKVSHTIGRNFYDEVAPFENTEEFRQCVNRFVKSDFPSKNFIFECRIDGRNVPVKIMLVRVTDRTSDERTKLTIVDIREA